MTDSSSAVSADLPLVSVVMLAFNQRDMVGEAMTSLLGQDYANYELIVSDDNSTDGTFEVMQEVAAAYAGPHAIRVNRTTANRGTLSHLYEAIGLSRGPFIVVAGGDDISLPHRVSRLVAEWRSTGAEALFSSSTVIDDSGRKLLDGTIYPDPTFQSYFPARRPTKIYGAMAAYDRRVFEMIPLPDEPVYCEDVFLSLMIYHRYGKVVALHDRLVLYRNHQNSFTNSFGSSISVEKAELKAQRLSADMRAILHRFGNMVEADRRAGRDGSDVDLSAIRRMEAFYGLSANWIGMTFADRLRRLTALRSREHVRWALPRVFGLAAFARFKAVQRAVRPGR